MSNVIYHQMVNNDTKIKKKHSHRDSESVLPSFWECCQINRNCFIRIRKPLFPTLASIWAWPINPSDVIHQTKFGVGQQKNTPLVCKMELRNYMWKNLNIGRKRGFLTCKDKYEVTIEDSGTSFEILKENLLFSIKVSKWNHRCSRRQPQPLLPCLHQHTRPITSCPLHRLLQECPFLRLTPF